MMRQGFDRNTLPFKAPLQPFAAWYAMISCLVICIVRIRPSLTRLLATHCPAQFSGWNVFLKGQWDTATFITNYLPCAFVLRASARTSVDERCSLGLFPVLYIGARLYFKCVV
jgi:amino acid transporter